MFNVYIPCDSWENLDEFLQILSQLSSDIYELVTHYIAMIGDFDANLMPGVVSLFGNDLKSFSEYDNFYISDTSWCDRESFTFYSETHHSISWLDYCVTTLLALSNIKLNVSLYDV